MFITKWNIYLPVSLFSDNSTISSPGKFWNEFGKIPDFDKLDRLKIKYQSSVSTF
jgi:hypothetical protein